MATRQWGKFICGLTSRVTSMKMLRNLVCQRQAALGGDSVMESSGKTRLTILEVVWMQRDEILINPMCVIEINQGRNYNKPIYINSSHVKHFNTINHTSRTGTFVLRFWYACKWDAPTTFTNSSEGLKSCFLDRSDWTLGKTIVLKLC